jgi:hypothetical protein
MAIILVAVVIRIAKFFLVQFTSTGKIYTQLTQNIPHVHLIYQMSVK